MSIDASGVRDNIRELGRRKILGVIHGTMSFGSLFATGYELIRGPELPYGLGLLSIAWLTLWLHNSIKLNELGNDDSSERVEKATNMYKGIGRGQDPRSWEEGGDRPPKKRGRKGPRND